MDGHGQLLGGLLKGTKTCCMLVVLLFQGEGFTVFPFISTRVTCCSNIMYRVGDVLWNSSCLLDQLLLCFVN